MTFSLPTGATFCVALLLAQSGSVSAAEAYPDPAQVTAAMKKAVAFYQTKLAVHGGYASSWDTATLVGRSEHHASKTLIEIQPPGTPATGLTMLKAFQATGDTQFLDAAKGAAQALMECQLASGGWSSDFDFEGDHAKKYHLRSQVEAGDKEKGKREASTTLDDNKTQSALLFLLELAYTPAAADVPGLKTALQIGLDALLAGQFSNGGWPQQFDGPADTTTPVVKAHYPAEWPRKWPAAKYSGFYTLNDDNMRECVRLLLRAYELSKDERYLTSAKKAGDFFLLAQMPEPQPVWAQQYNQQMEPVWARKFEPASVTGGESLSTMESLFDIWVVTGDEKYLTPMKPAIAWFKRSVLPDGQYARFYELQTNKPLYFVKDTYEMTYDDSNMPTHYGFKLDTVARDLGRLEENLAKPREELLEHRKGPSTEKKWTSVAKGTVAKVRAALEAQNADGVWVKKDGIDSSLFIKHMNAMALYVEAAKKSGSAFQALQK